MISPQKNGYYSNPTATKLTSHLRRKWIIDTLSFYFLRAPTVWLQDVQAGWSSCYPRTLVPSRDPGSFFFQWGSNFTFPSLVAEQTPDSAAAGGSSWTGWAVTSLTSKLYRGGSIPAAGAPEHAKTVDKDKNLGMTKYNASPKTNPVCFSRSAIGSRP